MWQSSGRQKKFEYIEHPADIALRVHGNNLPDLFKNAVTGVYDVLKPQRSESTALCKKEINVSANSIEGLLIVFLNEILYFALEKHLIFTEISINIECSGNENKLKCEMAGCNIDGVEREVKAVTYHNVKIKEKGTRLQTDIILDI